MIEQLAFDLPKNNVLTVGFTLFKASFTKCYGKHKLNEMMEKLFSDVGSFDQNDFMNGQNYESELELIN